MKVAYILPISWGGIPHYTAELANAVSQYCDVAVLKPKDNNDSLFNDKVEIFHISDQIFFSYKNMYKSIFSLNMFRNLVNTIFCENIIDELNPDLIHFPELYPQTIIFSYITKIYKKYPIIITLHSTFSSIWDTFLKTSLLKNPIYGLLATFTDISKFLISADVYIVHSIRNKYSLINRGIPSERIIVIPHGVYSIFKKFKEKEINYNENINTEYSILYFGYIKKNKGVEYLIKSVPIIYKTIKNFKVIIAGEGKIPKCSELYEPKLRQMFKIYNEYIPNYKVFDLFYHADVVVLPYTFHLGHSGVLTIALSFGKPVVVTNVGDFPNVIRDGKEGFVVPPKDPKALAEAIVRILEDDRLRKKMSRNALKKAEELSWDKIAKRHIKVYEEVLEGDR